MSNKILLTVIMTLLSGVFGQRSYAQICAGCLDPTFGSGGKSFITAPGSKTIHHLLIQSDGKFIAMNNGTGTGGHTVMRLNADGTIDTAFGNLGIATFNWSLVSGNTTYWGNANDVALQNIGGSERIVIVGQAPILSGRKVLTSRLRIDRLLPNGSFDPSWGTNGVLQLDTNSAIAVAVQPDQKIVLVSATYQSVMRLNSNGTIDTSFGPGGIVSGAGDCRNVTIDASGRIVVVNRYLTGSGNNQRAYFAVRRYSPSGSPETSFGGTGQTTAFQTANILSGLTIDFHGNILVSGKFNDDFVVARLNDAGYLDTSFSGDGVATVDFAGFPDGPAFVAVQSDGKVVLAGEANFSSGSNTDFGIVRFNYDGSLDPTFGTGGKVSFDMQGADSVGSAAIYNDAGCACEKILVAGGGSSYSTFARLLTY